MKNIIDFVDKCQEKSIAMLQGNNSLSIDFLLENTSTATVTLQCNGEEIREQITKGKEKIVTIPEDWYNKKESSVINLLFATDTFTSKIAISTEYGEKEGDLRIVKENDSNYRLIFFKKKQDSQPEKEDCCITGKATWIDSLQLQEVIIGECEIIT